MRLFDLSTAQIEARLDGFDEELRAHVAATNTPICGTLPEFGTDVILEWPATGRRLRCLPDGTEEELLSVAPTPPRLSSRLGESEP